MKMSEYGIQMLKDFEGCRLEAYTDTAGVRTIGYGHAYYKGESPITKTTAEKLLLADISIYEGKVDKWMSKYDFTQYEYDALVSFAFNIGTIDQLVANGVRDKKTIARKMVEYVKSGGKVIKGLQVRRKKERDLFLYGYPKDAVAPPVKSPTLNDNLDLIFAVIRGDYGNGAERKKKLNDAGYDYKTVQEEVNRILALMPVVEAVIAGDYGNGKKRKELLEGNGYDYKEVQSIVNYKLRHKEK